MRTASINLMAIPREAIIEGKKGKYINITIFDNDEPDQYGNDFSIQISRSKEERENKVKPVYIGNGKIWDKPKEEPKTAKDHAMSDPADDNVELPF